MIKQIEILIAWINVKKCIIFHNLLHLTWTFYLDRGELGPVALDNFFSAVPLLSMCAQYLIKCSFHVEVILSIKSILMVYNFTIYIEYAAKVQQILDKRSKQRQML